MNNSVKKIVVITGVTRGLGRAMVEPFIQAGWNLAGCGRSVGKIEELRARYGAPHLFSVVDVAEDEQVRAWALEVMKVLGVPGLLVNNAAIINRPAPLWELEAQEFSEIVDINLKGVSHVIRHLVPAMVAQGRGVIVNFSSGWGRSTDRDVAAYCATKWAIEGLTQAMAQELPRGMAAVALNPGIIDTEMLRVCFGPSAANYPSAEEWAETAVPFLLSLKAGHNGQSLTVPG